jgi:hypothetical protein
MSRLDKYGNMIEPRNHDKTGHGYVDPSVPLNLGLWILFAGASFFLALRLWIKITRRHGMWYDDWILVVCWVSERRVVSYGIRQD